VAEDPVERFDPVSLEELDERAALLRTPQPGSDLFGAAR
jgi:hypothetical protein